MSEQNYQFPAPQPPKKNGRRTVGIVLGLLAFAIMAFVCAGIASVASNSDKHAGNATKSGTGIPSLLPADDPAGEPEIGVGTSTITKADVKLSVKTTSKQCFGTAGCNVEYQVKADWPGNKLGGRECDVTYKVTGLEDAAINTLTLVDDTTYEHASTEFGSTPRSSSKLKVTVTDLDCS